jgi:hypothetical protein
MDLNDPRFPVMSVPIPGLPDRVEPQPEGAKLLFFLRRDPMLSVEELWSALQGFDFEGIRHRWSPPGEGGSPSGFPIR